MLDKGEIYLTVAAKHATIASMPAHHPLMLLFQFKFSKESKLPILIQIGNSASTNITCLGTWFY